MTTHIHMDPIGGISGDMFVSAMVDAWPDLESGVLHAIADVMPGGAACSFREEMNGGLRGKRFIVDATKGAESSFMPYVELDSFIRDANLQRGTRDRARDIYRHLAEAEAWVHGVTTDMVHFHELSSWDSIADIVGAAWLIEQVGECSWSTTPLPLGAGTVQCEHGLMPVPAPATTYLLKGFIVTNDGILGERVTPTGAAILAHIQPAARLVGAPLVLGRSGTGLGTRTLPGIPNVLRLLVARKSEEVSYGKHISRDYVTNLVFGIDDQTPEDLGAALEHLRAIEGVLDVVQIPCIGKKSRMTVTVEVLAQPAHADSVVDAIFRETTTLGVRVLGTMRYLLERTLEEIELGGSVYRVKSVQRPEGRITRKIDMDDLTRIIEGHAARQAIREKLEAPGILEGRDGDGDE